MRVKQRIIKCRQNPDYSCHDKIMKEEKLQYGEKSPALPFCPGNRARDHTPFPARSGTTPESTGTTKGVLCRPIRAAGIRRIIACISDISQLLALIRPSILSERVSPRNTPSASRASRVAPPPSSHAQLPTCPSPFQVINKCTSVIKSDGTFTSPIPSTPPQTAHRLVACLARHTLPRRHHASNGMQPLTSSH